MKDVLYKNLSKYIKIKEYSQLTYHYVVEKTFQCMERSLLTS